jgi:hypothetical protein
MAAPTDFIPTPVSLPASITSPPTLQFVPPPECNDPSNNWIVTTSCYLNLPHTIAYPEWLTCSISHFGAPSWFDPSCHIPAPTEAPSYQDAPKVTVDGVVSYYAGCPLGYSTERTTTYPGYNTVSRSRDEVLLIFGRLRSTYKDAVLSLSLRSTDSEVFNSLINSYH